MRTVRGVAAARARLHRARSKAKWGTKCPPTPSGLPLPCPMRWRCPAIFHPCIWYLLQQRVCCACEVLCCCLPLQLLCLSGFRVCFPSRGRACRLSCLSLWLAYRLSGFPIHWTQFIEVPSVALALLAALHVGSCSPALLGSGGRGREKKKNIVTPRLLLLGVGCLPGRRGCGPNRALCHVG